MKKGTAGSPKAQEVLRRYERLRQETLRADFVELMGTPGGRRLMRHIIFDICALDAVSFNTAAGLFAFNDGRRSVGVELRNSIRELCPDLWVEGELEDHREFKRSQVNQQAAEAAAQGEDE